MTWQETRLNLQTTLALLYDELKKKYRYEEKLGRPQFVNDRGNEFIPYILGDEAPWNCIVIEYSETGEDGDLFYPADYNSFEDMFREMIVEIES